MRAGGRSWAVATAWARWHAPQVLGAVAHVATAATKSEAGVKQREPPETSDDPPPRSSGSSGSVILPGRYTVYCTKYLVHGRTTYSSTEQYMYKYLYVYHTFT